MKSALFRIVFGLALAMPGLAQAVPPAKPTKPPEEDALKKAIDAVNRGVEKGKTTEEGATPTGKTADPPKPAPVKPAATKPSSDKPAVTKPAPEKPPPPPTTTPAKPATATPANPATAKPEPASPPTTRITSEEDVDFRNKEGLIIYRKNVLVDRPDLKIWCDELQISLNQQTVKKTDPPPTEPPPKKKPADDSDGFSAQNVKEALAKAASAGFVVIWRKTLKGEIVAMAREALYDGATGNITLKGVPEVLRDLKLHISSGGEADQLLLMKNGNVKGGGTNRTAMVQENEGKEIRKHILGHAPVRRGGPPAGAPPTGASSSAAVPPAVPPIIPK